jgi:hypothetical protein
MKEHLIGMQIYSSQWQHAGCYYLGKEFLLIAHLNQVIGYAYEIKHGASYAKRHDGHYILLGYKSERTVGYLGIDHIGKHGAQKHDWHEADAAKTRHRHSVALTNVRNIH